MESADPGRTIVLPARKRLVEVWVAGALILAAWAPAAGLIWHRWFPDWDMSGLTLDQRLTGGTSYYVHAPLGVAAAVLMALWTFRRRGLPAWATPRAAGVGAAVLVLCGLIHVVSLLARLPSGSGFALVGTLAALALLWGGTTMLRAYAPPIVFLALMVPLPASLLDSLSLWLKHLAAASAVWLVDQVLGLHTHLEGSRICLPDRFDGMPQFLWVDGVCSGLRSLLALVSFGAFFALFARLRRPGRVVVLAAAVPVAIGCNIIRIALLVVAAAHFGTEVARLGSGLHDGLGALMYAVALGVFFVLEWLIPRLGRLLGRDWIAARYLPPRSHPGPTDLRTWRPGAWAILAAVALGSWWAAAPSPVAPHGDLARTAVADTLDLPGGAYFGTDHALPAETLLELGTDDYLWRTYASGPHEADLGLLIVFSPENRKSVHPPEGCLEGEGNHLSSVAAVDVTGPGGRTYPMRELVCDRDGHTTFYLYVYKCGPRYTRSFLGQQLQLIAGSLLGHNPGAALIRISAPVRDDGPDSARALARAAAQRLLPEIDAHLP
jgi:EpsI family protein